MNRPEMRKASEYGGSNKSQNDLPPRRSVLKNPEVSLRTQIYFNNITIREHTYPEREPHFIKKE